MRLISSLFFAFTLSIFPLACIAEPTNLSLLRKEIQQYHDSGLYEQELTKTIEQAERYLIEQVQILKNKKAALVLDIDETSLSNYDKMAKRGFIGTAEQIHQEILAANSPPIQPMLTLYHDALKHGINVFFVTGRTASEREATKTNLIKAGFTKWSGLYLRPEKYCSSSIIPFKSHARAVIEQRGYIILASIGDQYSDIKGGYAEKGFKLPNPFYYLP